MVHVNDCELRGMVHRCIIGIGAAIGDMEMEMEVGGGRMDFCGCGSAACCMPAGNGYRLQRKQYLFHIHIQIPRRSHMALILNLILNWEKILKES